MTDNYSTIRLFNYSPTYYWGFVVIISIASGKGGTGKTTVATNLAMSLESKVQLLDCDVEEPNSHLFINPTSRGFSPMRQEPTSTDGSRRDPTLTQAETDGNRHEPMTCDCSVPTLVPTVEEGKRYCPYLSSSVWKCGRLHG